MPTVTRQLPSAVPDPHRPGKPPQLSFSIKKKLKDSKGSVGFQFVSLRPENHIFSFKVPDSDPEMPLKAHASSAVGAKNRSPPCPNITTTLRYRAHRRTPPILIELSTHYTGGRAQSACAKRDASNHDITMFGMSGCRQTLSKSISDHQISAKTARKGTSFSTCCATISRTKYRRISI